jgi:membrane protein
MPSIITIIKKAWVFVSEQIWQVRIGKVDKKQGILIRQLRIITLSIKGFNEDDCLTKATALTYYTLFSIVPILALAFAIAKGFGFEKGLQEQIIGSYPQYKDLLENAFTYASKMLQSAKGGLIAGVGVLLLLWTVMKLLLSIENNFNDIWEIKRGRTWVRKVTDYLAIMIISPIFLFVSGGLTVAIQTQLGGFEFLSGASTILLKLFAYFLLTCVFALLYLVMPNTKVNTKSAFVAGTISMILFQILEWAYIKFQIGANQMNAIYGTFAALPLFLIWLQYSWYIVLFGAELAFANQFADHYELENDINKLSVRYKKTIGLLIANLIAKRFYNSEHALTAQEIAEKLDIPLRLARNVINEFIETGVLTEIKGDKEKESAYQPGLTESKLTVKNILNMMETKGVNHLPIFDTEELKTINGIMTKLDQVMDNDELGGKPVKDIL